MWEKVMSDPELPGTTSPSRHQRFRAIMDAAAGASHADYLNHPRFWNLPLPELRNFELYGIAMMRPGGASSSAAEPGSCCHAGATPAPQPALPHGAADAGLVRGLRGQYPFDDTQFPPLPWGGTRVAEPDIAFIAQWIADGCPAAEQDGHIAAAFDAPLRLALATGQAAHPLFTAPTNELADDSGTVKARKNIAYLSPEELRRLRAAIAQMKSLDDYQQDERSFAFWARIHANQCQHGWEQFLTWHRAYLYGFEKRLQDIDPTVTLPYWDWAADAQNVQASIDDMGDAINDNGYVPLHYQCWIDEDGLRKLTDGGKVPQAVLDGLRSTLKNPPYSSGARLFKAAGIQYGDDLASDDAIKAVLGEINPLWHWKRWPGGNKNLIFEAYPSPDNMKRILGIDDFFDFGSGSRGNQFFGALENVHNLIHNFSGGVNPYFEVMKTKRPERLNGDMVDPGTTAFDPIFWGHHSNCDRLWSEWQRLHPGSGPDDPGDVLPPWNFTVDDMASISRLGYEYMMASNLFLTNNTMPLQRFESAASAVHPMVLTHHDRAEIRLHAVQYVARPGFHIRAFLNSPAADVSTPTLGNPNYVGIANMFTGTCIGGPGHCDVPARRTDRFDLRPRPHKTPTNIRFDATEAVNRLGAAGATSFNVNLVVLNTDGTPATDALKIDAVSLNFFDRPLASRS
jgi:tyrosinase